MPISGIDYLFTKDREQINKNNKKCEWNPHWKGIACQCPHVYLYAHRDELSLKLWHEDMQSIFGG